MPRSDPHPLLVALDGSPSPLREVLERLPIPVWIADRMGFVQWMNGAARSRLGRRIGGHFSGFIASEGVNEARELFARKVLGALDASLQRTVLISRVGQFPVEMVSVPIRDGSTVIGVFTIVRAEPARNGARETRRPTPRLTPRQHEVLHLLTHGCSTSQIAETLQIAEETARNHIRLLLNELGVHTRLEAVVRAFRNDWF